MQNSTMITLDTLNAATTDGFAAALEGVFEFAPWVARRAAGQRPFASVEALHAALMAAVRAAPDAEVVAFLGAHPELAARSLPSDLTDASHAEQTGLAMQAAEGADDLPALNRDYRARFGFPFIICVGRHTAEDVLRQLHARLGQSGERERETALAEVERISRLRLLARVSGPGAPAIGGHLGSHVLDLAAGSPGRGLRVTLLREGRAVAASATDGDGRVDDLLPPGPLRQGRYELQFAAGAYFAAMGVSTFYDSIPVRFVIDAAEGRYHIPLLLSPYGYSTYRGS